MANTRAANRYATALLDLAKEKAKTEEVFKNLQDVKATLDHSKELRNVLKSPVINPSAKSEVVKSVFSKTDPITGQLFNILIQNNRINILDQVAESYITFYNDLNNIKVAQVTTAEKLTPEMNEKVLAKVKQLTGGSSVTINNFIDKTILGGFILRVGDMQYDASVSGKLNALKNKFKNNGKAVTNL